MEIVDNLFLDWYLFYNYQNQIEEYEYHFLKVQYVYYDILSFHQLIYHDMFAFHYQCDYNSL